MSRKYKFTDNDKLYFISFAVVYCIDLFIRKEYKQIVIDSWKYCQEHKDLEIYGWCIMTSHMHMILGSRGRKLDKTVGEMKSFTSTNLKDAIRNHTGESRKEWMIWMMERAGQKNGKVTGWKI